MINKILANRYEILEKIGTGGMGNVFKAHDRKLDRIVAIKVLKLEYNEDNNFIRKFKRESLAAASISHPNIVSIYDVGTEKIDDKEVHYIVMEYIDGKTLKDLINDEGRLSEKRALNYCIQIAEALKVAHSKHIVHRDIKSQNIMVTRDDRIKVTDFGIARVADNTTVTATNAVMGSVHYFSPEQARGAKVDNRSDIYSLGIVLFEMLTGRLPFDADNPVSVALMQVQSQMPKPSDYIKSIDPSVDALVLKMTEKDPNDRYEDVFDLIRDIKDYTIGAKTFTVNRSYEEDDDRTVVTPPISRRSERNNLKRTDNNKKSKPKKVVKKKKSVAPAILGVFSAIIIIALLIYVVPKAIKGMKSDDKVEKIVVENYIGKTREEAKELIEAQGLVLDVSTVEDENKPDGVVLEQNPEKGSEVEKGSTVKLAINELPDSVPVPPLKGLTQEEAEKTLKENSLKLGSVEEEFNEEVEEGKVIYSNPDGGYSVKRGTAVKVIISKGVDKTPVVLSDYKGMDQDVVVNQLKSLGITVVIENGNSNKVAEGQVYDMDPKAGETVEKGSTVTLYISKGASDDEEENEDTTEENENGYNKVNNVKVKVPDDGETHKVTAERVKDAKGNKISAQSVWNYNIDSGETTTVELIGPGEYNIYVDGNIAKTETIK
ncbi:MULTISPECIES: Stk1 family PASTA domain-containing Ser/Thr kinase [Peptoniphilus]|jgi:putative serine/threonine-protein kinase prkC|uniref:Stk1 family PASTA domain-containing Ser/Thr kinase n=2 Tax=Peptoniphilaceae TaxID=1570339 RepID=UPI0008D8DDAA|nr:MULTISPECIES: Stk1 family PASTA domain-containing Ser/Thr kinase [Peptoniphilus]MBS6610212.1 Stk1 family PASTA domain-containing Ser/Thr kinase [Peptoniphilus harei]MDU1043296.1 Stk1 family PASTA domain-containing Ser/Thr kinase [Peptoniphilus rhinitidis]MDU1954013.1 Stk1 family PASTA domain-containing Ser/Thr kinase [Peptoniphilus lacydonensis]MDU2115251.1 Stk1 family PASTA domain-containing Ser/Thr kinase [Peptoniphilus lacydonensis]MDU5275166.1 Stk1 family PASTA domain-containing Ser/Thr